jgi:transmembrane sensor
MSRLTFPLRPLLRDGFTEAHVQRVWHGIRNGSAWPSSRRRHARWAWSGAAVAAAVGLVLVFHFWPRYPVARGPLELAGGGLPTVLVVSPPEPGRLVGLADGSRMTLVSGTRLDVVANDGHAFFTVLRRGGGAFQVRPGGQRRWVVECGLATIEVVGTEFSLHRSPGRLEVSVVRGSVSVLGDNVSERQQVLKAGERLVVTGVDPDGAVSHSEPAPTPVAPGPAIESSPAASGSAATSTRPSSHARATLDELVREADAARGAGDLDTATVLLERTVREAGSDPRGAIAALTLARLNLNRSPARVVWALNTALGSGVPRGLEEDLLARLVQARARSGDRAGARRTALEYQRRFPTGARLDEVRRWAAE